MTNSANPFFLTRGVILLAQDMVTAGWAKKAKAAGLNTIATTHLAPTDSDPAYSFSHFANTVQGKAFLDECRAAGIEIEHEWHAINKMLPRELFNKDPAMFRMNEQGERTPDCNLCVHSRPALDVVCENVVSAARIMRSTTGRYFFWTADGRPMCRCPQCRGLSDSDQTLILQNTMLHALQEFDPGSTLAHLAYSNTLKPPTQVKPDAGIFLEFAPIQRSYQVPLICRETCASDPKRANHAELLDALEANLAVFGRDNAQVLEYWLDVSLFSNWKREATVKLPWKRDVFLEDLKTYATFGIRHITSFACYLDGDYIKRFGEPPIKEYGAGLLKFTT